MSTRFHLLCLRLRAPRPRRAGPRACLRRIVLGVAVIGALRAGAGGSARAEDLVLRGPLPDLKDNAVAVQLLIGSGLGDSFSGRGVGLGYGFMLRGQLWLDLQMNLRVASCGLGRGTCGPHDGSDAEVLAGVAWRFHTNIPLVPFVRGAGGLIYLDPSHAPSAAGIAARGGVGAKYYVYDWLGFGVEAALTLGHGFFADGYTGDRTYAVVDVGLGVEWQF